MSKSEHFFGRANAEMHSIFSCACGFIKKYFNDAFPPGYFKNMFITTRMGGHENDGDNGEDLVKKKLKPQLSITPRFDFGMDSTVLGLMPNAFYTHTLFFRNLHKHYPIVFNNEEDGYTIAATPDRFKVDFEIKIRVDSYLKLLRLANFVRRRLWINRPFYVNNVEFETEIPKSMIKILIGDKEVDSSNPESVKEFNDYIERFSTNSVRFKKVLSTGNNSHTYSYFSNVLARIESISMDDYNRKGQIEEHPALTIGVWIEFWAPSSFIFKSLNEVPEIIMEEANEYELENEYQILTINSAIIPILKKTVGNYSLIDWAEYLTEEKIEEGEDVLNLDSLLGADLKLLMRYILSKNEDISQYFMVKLFMDSSELEIGTDFTVDFYNFKLSNKNPRLHYKYTCIIYADLKNVKDKLELMYKEKNLNNLFQKSYKKEFTLFANQLEVKFNKTIKNSMIALNGRFHEFERIDDFTIRYPIEVSHTYKSINDNKIHVFNWDYVELDEILTPINIEGNVLVFENGIKNAFLVTYDGKLIEYNDKPIARRIALMQNITDEYDLGKFRIYTFKSYNSSVKVHQLKGKVASYEKLNYYNVDISRSIVTVNGLVEDYEIYERFPKLISFIKSDTGEKHFTSNSIIINK